jgi:hypothetical protein
VNPFGLDATGLMVWGLVAHLIADWPFQSDWMAKNKTSLRHPAGYVHAGIHGLALAPVFGWLAVTLAVAHLLIDTRKPVAWLSARVGQTPPDPSVFPLMDVGTTVRFWTDQVWHVASIAIVALVARGGP